MASNGISTLPHVQASIRSFFLPRTAKVPPSQTLPLTPSQPSVNPGVLLKTRTEQPNSHQDSNTKSALPPQASITLIQPHHIQPLRRINSLLLPINYPDSFYSRILEPHLILSFPISFSRVILWKDGNADPKVIGGVVCRVDPNASSPTRFDLYIQSLALLSPYRSKGLATAVLEEILNSIKVQQEYVLIASLYVHVWTENKEALTWYEGRNFAKEGGMINGYYRRLKPDTAWVMRRNLAPSDLLPSQIPAPPQMTLSNVRSDPSITTSARPSPMVHSSSFQDRRPDREWNDLPDDVLGGTGLLKPPPGAISGDGSRTSSRSSSRNEGREKAGKKKRSYPAAAFGEAGSR